MSTFWHLTSNVHAAMILGDGRIRTAESNIGSPHPDLRPYGTNYGPKVVWLLDTLRPDVVQNDKGLDNAYVDKKTHAFGVDVPAIKWTDWEWTTKMNPEWRDAFVRAGGGEEAAEHWYVFPAPILSRNWFAHLSDQALQYEQQRLARESS